MAPAITFWITISTTLFATAQFDGMLSRVPNDANTLIMIDAEKLFGSPLADRERWDARRKAAFEAGVSALPPDASAVLLASRTDYETGRNLWELALTRFSGGRDVTSVAKRFGGSIDEATARLSTFESFGADKSLAPSLGKLAGGIQGATLGITINNTAVGAIRVDFKDSPQAFVTVLKPVFLEVLQRHVAMVDDFENWEPSVQGNTFMLKGPLSTIGTRRILSVLELPPALTQLLDEASSGSSAGGTGTGGSGGAKPSQLDFQSITSLLNDLREKPKKDHVQTTGQAAMWYGKYALKLDNLPILGVDPTLLSFGADIAGGLRDAQSSLRGVGMRTSVRTMSNNNGASAGGPPIVYGGYSDGYGYGFGGYSYSYYDLRSGARALKTRRTPLSGWKNACRESPTFNRFGKIST